MRFSFFIRNGFLSMISLMLLSSSCGRSVKRISENETKDISGNWNNTDTRIVSEEMVNSFFQAKWLDNHLEKYGVSPVIIVGFVVNKSHEHIDAESFTKELEKEIVASNKARLVQGGAKRESIRSERLDQQTNASSASIKKFGLESGADYMIQGTITSVVDAHKKEKVVQYEVSLEATHIETNEVVWLSSKKITKYVKR